uniref:CBS domain-containing protein n=1 Tax=Caldimicrobium thiodismutans TaxID=1653476 RepID=A0A832GP46_9BACT
MAFEEKKVAEVMSRSLYTVSMDASFEEILQTMIESRVSAVIVLAPNGEFMGIVSKTDILSALKKYGAQVFSKNAEDLLCPKPYTIEGNATIKEAAQKMLAHKVHRLLVVSPSAIGRYMPVGIISATDILKEVAF